MAWIGPVVGAGAATAAAAQQAEEDECIWQLEQELGPEWEFKVVRSLGGGFRGLDALREVMEAEAEADWEIAHKIDDGRLIFKRQVLAQYDDHLRKPHVKPYREYYGRSYAIVVALLIGVLLLGIAVALMFVYMG
jgi:hypothetical protein